jgi:hypothetical protein
MAVEDSPPIVVNDMLSGQGKLIERKGGRAFQPLFHI